MSTDCPEKIDLGATVLIIELKQIVDADKTQIREQENGKVIDDLVMQYQMEEQAQGLKTDAYPKNLPPIVVVRTPADSKKFWIIDGHHRYAAAVTCRYKKIVASVIDNSIFQVKTLDDLHFLQGRENISVTANRTAETKRRQVLAVLKKRPYWTMNQIAQFCRVSFYLVESVIGEMESAGKKVATRKPAEKAAEAIANPKNEKKSNRQIAKETGVGEATVRRLRQNSNPKNDAPETTQENSSDPRAYNWKDPHCLLDGKPLNQGDATLYNDYDGTILSFCDDTCAKTWSEQNDRVWSEYSCNFVLQEVAEYMNKKNLTEQQKKDFVEGIRAYHESKNQNSMPKTKNWADKKLDGYMYEEGRLRQQRLLAKKKIGCAFCGKSEAPYVVALPDGKELSFCDEACACQYSCREGLYFESDDKRFYNNDAEARDAHALNNVSKKAQEFIDNNAPAEPAKEPYEKPEVLDAPPASADGKSETTHLTPQEIVTIDNDGNEEHYVGFALPIDCTDDAIVEIVVATLHYQYNNVMKVADKLIQAAKQQCSVNGVKNNPSKR